MASPLNSTTYPTLNEQILATLKSGKRAIISIYTNAEGTTPATDAHGDIIGRRVLSASFTESYKDKDDNTVNPYVTIKLEKSTFIDYFTTKDYEDDHWFVIGTEDIPKKKF